MAGGCADRQATTQQLHGTQWATFCRELRDASYRRRNGADTKTACRNRASLAEQIRMRTGSLEANRFALNAINQEPIGFDVQIAVGLPLAF